MSKRSPKRPPPRRLEARGLILIARVIFVPYRIPYFHLLRRSTP